MATLESLQVKIKKLERQADALIAKQSSSVIEKIRELMAKHGITTADIDAHAGGKQRTKDAAAKTAAKLATSVAKYRDPKSGATWTGHGRAPNWIAAAKNRNKYLVDAGTTVVKPLPAKNAKPAGAYVRGPQPAMYQDPKSGATWSGRGRAPAWLANVKDPSKFLIAGGTEATGAATAGAVSRAKVAGKKTASKSAGATVGTGQRKGPQPALYQDPKSGATWSRRGRAPAWLAGAKDRNRFLIEGAAAVSTTGAPKVKTEKAATKKVLAKKSSVANKKPAMKEAVAPRTAGSAGKNAAAKKTLPLNANAEAAPTPVAVRIVSTKGDHDARR